MILKVKAEIFVNGNIIIIKNLGNNGNISDIDE